MSDIDVVVEPDGNTAGVGVVHEPNAGGPLAEYQVVQLWPGGDAEAIHVGDRADAAALIASLAEAIADE